MDKDARIMVRMSAELLEWVRAEAKDREMDAAAFVRLVLLERRKGLQAPVAVPYGAYQLESQAPPMQAGPLLPAQEEFTDEAGVNVSPIDVDALVSSQLQQAAQGSQAAQPPRRQVFLDDDGPQVRGVVLRERPAGKAWGVGRYGPGG